MSDNSKSNGIGCLSVIGIMFIILKLLSVPPVSGWSWCLVLAPFWVPAVLGIAVIFFVIILLLVGAISSGDEDDE